MNGHTMLCAMIYSIWMEINMFMRLVYGFWAIIVHQDMSSFCYYHVILLLRLQAKQAAALKRKRSY